MATSNNIQVRDGTSALKTLRAYDVDGVQAQSPFIPEIGETGDAAWAGAGAGGVIAILKAMWTAITGTLSMRSGVLDDTDAIIYPDSMSITSVTRDADGNLLTETRSDGVDSWVMTITRDVNGYIATQSLWVRQ